MRVSTLVLVLCVVGSEPASAQTHAPAQAPQTHEAAPVKPPVTTMPAVPQPAKTAVPTVSSPGPQPTSAPKPATPDEKGTQAANGSATGSSTPAPDEAETSKTTIKRMTPDEIEARLQALRDKISLARTNAPKPRPRPRAAVAPKPIPRPRFVVHWPEERVTLSWPTPEERFSVSWPR